LGLIGLALTWWALADWPEPQQKERIDWLGTAVLSVCLLTLNIGLLASDDVQTIGGFAEFDESTPLNTSLYFAMAALSFLLFIGVEWWLGKRPKNGSLSLFSAPPLIDLTLFRRPNFSTAVVINFLVGSILIIAMVNVPLLLNVVEFDVQQAALIRGFLLSSMTLAMAIMSYVGGRQTEKRSFRPVTAVGLLLCTLGFGLMGLTWSVGTSYGQMAWQLVILGMGFGLVIAPIGTAVINAVPESQFGIAASLVIVLRLIGMSVGLSALTAWGLSRFQTLRTQIDLPDLPLTDPQYQQALTAGLTAVTVNVLVETFLISAVVALVALGVAMWLRRET
jgi:MFS family permease